MNNNLNLLLAGKVIAAFGIKGDLKVFSYLEDAKNFANYKNFYLKNKTPLKLKFIRKQKKFAIVKLNNICDRNECEKLVGTEIYIDKNEMPKLKPNQFYVSDLIGLVVKSRKGDNLGKVLSINNFGAGEVVEIKFTKGNVEMFSLTKLNFPEINVEKGFMILTPPIEEIMNV